MNFQIFADKELTKKIESPINLGKLKVGEEKEFTYYVFNSSMNPYEELEFSVDHKEVEVLSSPEDMEEKSSAKVVLKWKPSVDIRRGLKTSLKIEGFEVIG